MKLSTKLAETSAEVSAETSVETSAETSAETSTSWSGFLDTAEDCPAKYEICVVAPSMFDNNGFMRTPKKADLADFLVFEDCKTDYMQSGEMKVVLDGGALLHRVQWTKGTTFSDIKHNYLGHIKNLVGNTTDKDDVHIVFDGYLTSSTKDHCHLK